MQRRGFLQALMAAAAGLSAAKATVASSAPRLAEPVALAPKTTPQVAITADTKPFRRALDESQRTVMEMLKECRVTRVDKCVDLHGCVCWQVIYTHAPNAPRSPLDDEAEEAAATCFPASVTVSQRNCDVDVLDLGGFWKPLSLEKATYDIEVEWR